MRKSYLLFAAAAMSLVACNKVETITPLHNGEMSVVPVNAGAGIGTKGYVEGSQFVETYYNAIHSSKEGKQALRTMQISSYLTPQNGEQKNYFVDKTYSAKSGELTETVWWNTNTVGGDHDPIYWPVGGTLDFLAYSVSAEASGAGSSQNVEAVWDSDNASSKVVMKVPGENSQNDILFASAHGIKSSTGASSVPMQFNHAQAWIEFALTGSVDDVHTGGIVTLKRIELEKVYNAGTLTVTNNLGTPVAKWDFSGELNQNIVVDNLENVSKLNSAPQYLDMLIPAQTKTAFVIYYTLGNDPQELSYRFTTDLKTWNMGEKYIYNINITTSEVTVAPTVTEWNDVKEYNYTVKVPTTVKSEDGAKTFGTVSVGGFLPSEDSFEKVGGEDENGITTYTCDTWGAQVTLTAVPAGGYYFKEWSDGVTENPRTFTITEGVELPEAVFAKMATIKVAPSEFGAVSINSQAVDSLQVIPGSEVVLEATTGSTFKFSKWGDDNNTDATRTVTVTEDITYTPYFEVGVKYVTIAGLKWATQNLAITESGKKTWKKFTNANDDEIFVNGDYFQWGAYAGYCGESDAADKGLLTYTSFTSNPCGDGSSSFTFKEGKSFNIANAPYYESEGSKYTAYLGTGTGKAGLSALDSSDDVASIILNKTPDDKWRMPTSAEFNALKNATIWKWDSTDKGYYVFAEEVDTSKKYNALLFFPAAGNGYDSSFKNVGGCGRYCSSSLYSSDTNNEYLLYFVGGDVKPQYNGARFCGYLVRPVSD